MIIKYLKWKNFNSSLWVVCCLTSPSRWSAMFSSEPGRMSFLFGLPWMWRAWLTPAIAITSARRVTTAAVSMVSNWRGGQMNADDQGRGRFLLSDYTCWLGSAPEERRVLLRVKCPLCVASWLTSVVVTSSLGLIYTSRSLAGDPHESWRRMLLCKGEQGWKKNHQLKWDLTRSI